MAKTKEKEMMFKTHNDINLQVRERMIDVLNQQLADTFDLFSQVKQAHWNVKGLHFIELHLLFDTFAEVLPEYIDTIAERATALGGKALGTARMAAANSRLPEFPVDIFQDREVVEVLAQRYGAYGSCIREAISQAEDAEDQATMDIFIEIARTIDKHLYMLDAHLQA